MHKQLKKVAEALIRRHAELLQIKAALDYRKQVASLFVKQVGEVQDDLVEALTPLFQKQVDDVKSRIEGASGTTAEAIVDSIFDPKDYTKELIDIALPILAKGMEEAIIEFLGLVEISPDTLGKQTTRAIKSSASDWLEESDEVLPPGVSVDLPEWMAKVITETLSESFEQGYWDKIPETTRGDILLIVENGLEDGLSITRIAEHIADRFPDTYSKSRAVLVARTEVAGALNAARYGSIDELSEHFPDMDIRASWVSALTNNTRDNHALLDGVVANDDGLFDLGGHMVPYPGHHSLPAGERCNCLCTLMADFVI